MSRVDADIWVEDHDVSVRTGETQIEVPAAHWRILHYNDMFVHRCHKCIRYYTGMVARMGAVWQ